MNLANPPAVATALLEFYTDEHIVAMFKYAEGKWLQRLLWAQAYLRPCIGGLKTWFPKHQESFQVAVAGVARLHPELRQAIPGTSFAASTVNMGPRVVCRAHRDVGNVGPAICLDYVGRAIRPRCRGTPHLP